MLTKREEVLLRAVCTEMQAKYESRIAALEARTLERGDKGEPGKDAPPVDVDALFFRIKAELPALIPAPLKGEKGEKGDRGEKGDPGRDAAALEFVTLDVDKSYPRGTFALHKCGVLYAERQTDPVKGFDHRFAGWRTVIPGFEIPKVKLLSDDRTFEFAFERTDGGVETQRVKAPFQKHNGVWHEGVLYERGDQVQLSGSSWQARELTDKKPGEGKAWFLIARRGRDGKDSL